MACDSGKGGGRKKFTASEGDWDVCRITHDKKIPKKGSETPFVHVLGGLSPLCVSGQNIVWRGTAFNFQGPGGGLGFLGKP